MTSERRRLPGSDRLICIVYAVIAVGALIATWGTENLKFFALPNNGGALGFITLAYANPAAASIANDLVFLLLAAFTLMIVEAKRLGIRFVWVYMLLSFAIAISVMFPLFMIARQMKIAAQRPNS
jgi:membrane associated rhomboid family serine protease